MNTTSAPRAGGMNVQLINPFIESVFEFFTKMLQSKAQRGGVTLSDGVAAPRSLTALIGLSGPVRGTVALNLPTETALAVVNRLLGTELRIVDDTVSDGVMEAVNIIAGGAKARLPFADANPVQLSLPTAVRGGNFRIDHPSKSKWLEIPFITDLGALTLRITLEQNAPANGGAR